jgi:hypothetical protein
LTVKANVEESLSYLKQRKGGEAMKRLILMLYGVAAVVAILYPALSEARIAANHNETLVRDLR